MPSEIDSYFIDVNLSPNDYCGTPVGAMDCAYELYKEFKRFDTKFYWKITIVYETKMQRKHNKEL